VILADLPLWFLRVFAVLFGLIWGSFVNVVIYRAPRDMSVVRPRSHCPACGTPIAGYLNIPVLSYVILRGRARCCGAKMSLRYPAVEIICGALSLCIVEVVLRALPPTEPLGRALAIYGADFTLCMALVAAAFIDAEHMYLPDTITLGGALLGVATASFRDMSIVESLVGAGAGFFVLWIVGRVYRAIRGRTGAGLGDSKLLMLAGAWFGWQGLYFVILAGSVQGVIYAVVAYMVLGKLEEPESVKQERAELEKLAAEGDEEARQILEDDPLGKPPEEGFGKSAIPFGPFLILALLEFLFLRGPLASITGSLFSLE
jgi:leader peptidase (prepilin peptidase) / N-methyltransferase